MQLPFWSLVMIQPQEIAKSLFSKPFIRDPVVEPHSSTDTVTDLNDNEDTIEITIDMKNVHNLENMLCHVPPPLLYVSLS